MQTTNSVSIIKAPELLDKVFFETALQQGLRERQIRVKDIKISSATADGDNYCSQIYRVSLVFSKHDSENCEEKMSVIVKVMPIGEGLDFLDSMNVFDKEKRLLQDILPKFEVLLNNVQFAPRFYYATASPRETLVVEDMSSLGYQMADREIGLDERHANLAMKRLGQFHAASMKFAKENPSVMEYYNTGLIDSKAINPYTNVYKMLYKHLGYEIKLASSWKGFEKITQKMQEFHNHFESRVLNVQKPETGEIKVLNHGDFWTNNLLYKYDPQGSPVDVVFIDFQLSIYGSPGIDLNYFFFASIQLEILKQWKKLLKVYHASLSEALEELQYDEVPTYDDIEWEFKQKSCYGVFTLIGPLTLMTMDKKLSEGNSFENLATSDEKTRSIFSSQKLIERLKYSLMELEQLGALDIINK